MIVVVAKMSSHLRGEGAFHLGSEAVVDDAVPSAPMPSEASDPLRQRWSLRARGNISGMSDAQGLPVVLLSGWPGSGKSTVGRSLASRLSAALVDQDTVTGPLVAVVADMVGVHDLDDVRLAGPTRDARYETVAAVAEENLRAGIPVVLVAPFSRERRDPRAWEALDRRLRAAGGTPLLIWLQLEQTAVVARLQARGAPRDLAKLADPDSFVAGLDQGAPVGPHVVVDAEQPAADVVEEIVTLLSADPA
jgi:predicted kinase